MEIRRIETDRIPPPATNAQGARVEMDRRSSTAHDEDHEREEPADENAEREDTETAAPAVGLTAYDMDGNLREDTPIEHHLDTTA